MAIYRAQVSWGGDTDFPRDKMTITPHFKVTTIPPGGADPQSLADDLAAAIKTLTQPSSRRVDVKMYDAESPPPNAPLAIATQNPAGGAVPTTSPREVAVCLSFYADTNSPSRRGRLFLPLTCFYGGAAMGPRPSSVVMDAASAFVPKLTGLGGIDVDWVVWSRKTGQAHTVTNWFVDDEWDTVRSRGLKPTARNQGTTSG